MDTTRAAERTINVTMNREPVVASVEKPLFPSIDRKFSSIIGMDSVKDELKEIYAQEVVAKKRMDKGLKVLSQSKHMIFEGNPGTGKTTVARILGELMKETGILHQGHLVEVDRSCIVGEYVGQTAKKTKEMMEAACDGILFIDEAYALARGGENDFGKEAVDTLVKGMEDFRDRLVVILAGYPLEMKKFMNMNPGLRSRFPYYIRFRDYTAEELFSIITRMLKERDYLLSPGAAALIGNELNGKRSVHANARFARNLVEEMIRKHSLRMITYNYTDKKHLITIEKDDVIACTKERNTSGERKGTITGKDRPFP